MKPPRRVYLSGGMEYADNEGREWRRTLQAWIESELRWTVFNPNIESDSFFQREFPGVDIRPLKATDPIRYKNMVARLVELDCKEIAGPSDLVICYWDQSAMRGAGTKGELTIAKHFGKPVYMVTMTPLEDIPGWVLACTTQIFRKFSDLKSFLQSADLTTTPSRQSR